MNTVFFLKGTNLPKNLNLDSIKKPGKNEVTKQKYFFYNFPIIPKDSIFQIGGFLKLSIIFFYSTNALLQFNFRWNQ